jgi:hypothetical protein
MTGTTRPVGAPPTPTQATTVAVLDSLTCEPDWVVDAVPVDTVAPGPCANDWAHGPGTVYGGPCGGLCLPCAVAAVTAAHWDATGPDVVSLDVLRNPAELRTQADWDEFPVRLAEGVS